MNSYSLTRFQLPRDLIYEKIEHLHVFGNSAIIDGKIEILHDARAALFMLLYQAQFFHLGWREHGNQNVHPGGFEPTEVVTKPVTTARARSNGQPK